MKRRGTRGVVALLAIWVALVAGCTGPGSSGAASQAPASAGPASAAPASAAPYAGHNY